MKEMRKITIFYDGSHYIFRWLKALLVCKSEFKKQGVLIGFADIQEYFMHSCDLEKLKSKLSVKKYDIVFFAFHHDSELNKIANREKRNEILKVAKEHSNKLVWLDTADSTGTTQFEVLPYVDRYLKKQLLKDTTEYKKSFYAARPHCDYYHIKYDLIDDSISNITAEPLNEAYASKLGISWNVAIGDLYANGGIQYLFPFWRKKPKYMNCNLNAKKYDVHFRGSAWSIVAGWQRKKCIEELSRYKDSGLIFPDPATKVKKKEYIKELRNTKSVISPYGWGEICGRDFESFAYGAVLIKPSMEHLVTYPDWYRANETYLPLDWDLSNFDCVLQVLKNDTELMQKIADSGQKMLKEHLSDSGKKLFVTHVLEQVGM